MLDEPGNVDLSLRVMQWSIRFLASVLFLSFNNAGLLRVLFPTIHLHVLTAPTSCHFSDACQLIVLSSIYDGVTRIFGFVASG